MYVPRVGNLISARGIKAIFFSLISSRAAAAAFRALRCILHFLGYSAIPQPLQSHKCGVFHQFYERLGGAKMKNYKRRPPLYVRRILLYIFA